MASTGNKYPTYIGALALILAIVSLCTGTSFAKMLFTQVGAQGTTTFRLGFSAIILWLIWRPWKRTISIQDFLDVLPYAISLALMNTFIYMAMETIPIGIALAIQFIGPLGVAVLSSRSRIDFLWIGLVILGMYLLVWPLQTDDAIDSLDLTGVLLAFLAGVFWGCYIFFGQRTRRVHPGLATTLGISMAAFMVLPYGVYTAGWNLLETNILLVGLAVAILSSALPYSLEMFSLRILPAKTYSITLSLEPAVGALAGLIILGELLSLKQVLAIILVGLAALGSTLSSNKMVRVENSTKPTS